MIYEVLDASDSNSVHWATDVSVKVTSGGALDSWSISGGTSVSAATGDSVKLWGVHPMDGGELVLIQEWTP